MPSFNTKLKRILVFFHRWMGVGFCLLFLTWFASGFVMMYWDFPNVSSADRLSRADRVNPLQIQVSPQQAYAKLITNRRPTRVTVGMFDGRAAYRFRFGRAERIVYAENGQEQTGFPPELTLRIASAWTRQPSSTAIVEENTEEDQWTVSGEFRALRPMRKYSWPDGEQVYVSTITGEVAQYTTRGSRTGAYLGAIPHWLYFTPLRKHGKQWSQLVIWASGLGTIAAMLGVAIGLWMYSPSKAYRYEGSASSIPYTGQKRWHAILGLTFGVFACSWAFSGMLSMDPFPQLQEGASDEMQANLSAALRGTSPLLPAFSAKQTQEALFRLNSNFPVRQMELISFAGEPFYLATSAPNESRIIPVYGEPVAEFPRDKIVQVLGAAAQPAAIVESRMVTEYESYYLDRRHRLPLPAIFVQLDDSEQSGYYVDPRTARIVQSYNARSRRNRWFYHGLHSMDLPWLYKHRPAWDAVVLTFLAGGTCLCVTSVILGWRVLRRKTGH